MKRVNPSIWFILALMVLGLLALWCMPAMAGTINITGQTGIVNVPNGSPADPTLVTGKATCAGIVLANPASNVTIDGIDLISTGNGVLCPGNATDVKMIRSRLQWASGKTGFQVNGSATRVTIGGTPANSNFFHDSGPNSYRDAIFWSTTDVVYSFNRFYRTGYAAHIDGKHFRLKVEGNTSFQTWHVRGIEIQDEGVSFASPGDGVTFHDNIGYDFLQPGRDTFGFSIPPQATLNVNVSDCYFSLFGIGQTQPTQLPGQPLWGLDSHAGIGGEIAANNAQAGNPSVQRVTMVGPYVCAFYTESTTHFKDCKGFGSQSAWGSPVVGGGGSNPGGGKPIDDGGNQYNLPLLSAPPPWRTLAADGTLSGKWADGTPVSGGSTTQPIDNRPTSVTATASRDAAGKIIVTVSFAGGKAPFTVTRTPADSFAVPPLNGQSFVDQSFTDSQRNSTWRFTYAINGVSSNEIQIGPTTATTQPIDPAPADFDVDVTVQIRGGKATATATTRKAA